MLQGYRTVQTAHGQLEQLEWNVIIQDRCDLKKGWGGVGSVEVAAGETGKCANCVNILGLVLFFGVLRKFQAST